MDTYTQPVTTKRRYRSLEEKQRIVEEALAEGASVARSSDARSQRQSGLQLVQTVSGGATGVTARGQTVAGSSSSREFHSAAGVMA